MSYTVDVLEHNPVPNKKMTFETYCYGDCDVHTVHGVCGIEKNSVNADGSQCYVLRLKCTKCGYKRMKPCWYNFYELGCIETY